MRGIGWRMADELTNDEFLDLLSQSGLVSSTLFDTYQARVRAADPSQTTAQAIARALIADKVLTPFQAKQLLRRRFRGFFIDDKYKILLPLGQGGMGRVLLCEHLMLQRLVAVKLMNLDFDPSGNSVDRFLREARAAASMDHPNIARVFDVDRCDQGPYMVMEYVDGSTLHQLVAEHGQMAVERAAHYIKQAAAGLQRAHEAGLVHRDIKPSNLMLDRTGTIKLLDLGLARYFDNDKNGNVTQQNDARGVLGTTDFIAPEQAMDSTTADIRADIYSLGCTFYFMLLRRLTVPNGSMIQKLLHHQSRDPEPICSIRPAVPAGLSAIVDKMIKKKPEDRYQTPAELVEALEPWTAMPISPPPPEEMPTVTSSTFRLGLGATAPPLSGSGVSKVATTSSAMSAQVNTATTVGGRAQEAGSGTSSERGVKVSSSVGSLFEEELPDIALPGLPGSASSPGEHQMAGSIAQAVAAKQAVTTPKAPSQQATMRPQQAATETRRGQQLAGKSTNSSVKNKAVPQTAPAPQPAPAEMAHRSSRTLVLGGLLAGMTIVALGLIAFQQFSAARQREALVEMAKNSKQNPPPVAPQQPDPDSRQKSGAAATGPGGSGPVLRGGGSTFVKPIMELWAQVYEKETGTKIEYTAVGSSKGIEGVTARFLDFGCSDAYMTNEQLADVNSPILHIPLVIGAVVATYNVTDETGQPIQLRFTGPQLANIFLGKVKNWNDPAIALTNPGQRLPDLPIVPVHRKEGSGTTSVWTDYLSKASAAWKSQVGAGTKVIWPAGVAAEKNDGVADAVSRTAGAIGYVELSFALANGLPVGSVKNQAGNFIVPSIESITAAAAASLHDIPDDLRYSLTDAPGADSYPIVGTAWAVIYAHQPPTKAVELTKFLRWATGPGQQYASGIRFGSLPPDLVERVHQALSQVEDKK